MPQALNIPGILGLFRAFRHKDLLIPKCSIITIQDLDFMAAKEKAGIEAICFDKDNCLTLPYEDQVYPPLRDALEECKTVFGTDRTAMLSNSAGSSDDAPKYLAASRLEQSLGIPVIRHISKKPDAGQAIAEHFEGIAPSRIMFVGDRLLTDVLMANELGMISVHTQPLSEAGDNIFAKWQIHGIFYWEGQLTHTIYEGAFSYTKVEHREGDRQQYYYKPDAMHRSAESSMEGSRETRRDGQLSQLERPSDNDAFIEAMNGLKSPEYEASIWRMEDELEATNSKMEAIRRKISNLRSLKRFESLWSHEELSKYGVSPSVLFVLEAFSTLKALETPKKLRELYTTVCRFAESRWSSINLGAACYFHYKESGWDGVNSHLGFLATAQDVIQDFAEFPEVLYESVELTRGKTLAYYDNAPISLLLRYIWARNPAKETATEYYEIIVSHGENALLESPTGTGKTLCLLTAALAWRSTWVARAELEAVASAANYSTYMAGGVEGGGVVRAEVAGQLGAALGQSTGASMGDGEASFGKRKVPLIIYASRTHSQLAQVVKELKATVFRPKISVVGSREQLCVLPAVRSVGSNTVQQALCGQLVKKKACSNFEKVGVALTAYHGATQTGALMDIEEIVKFGAAHKACPYYLAREGNAEADVLFTPYNYLIDRKARAGLGLDLADAVVIFDEAHNLESFCGEASSFDLGTEEIRAAVEEVAHVMALVEKSHEGLAGNVGPPECKIVQAFLMSFLSQMLSVQLADQQAKQKSFRVDVVYDMVAKAGVREESIKGLLERMRNVAKAYIEDVHAKGKAVGLKSRLQNIESVLATLFKPSDSKDLEMVRAVVGQDTAAFRAHIVEEANTSPARRTLSLWCFNPGVALRDLVELKVRSVILASGTLSPMASFAQELQLPFKHRLENSHVIEADRQLFASVLPFGPRDIPLNSSYAQRDNASYKTELGLAIAAVAPSIPDGLLVFFPSYAVMDGCLVHWKEAKTAQNTSVWAAICKNKTPFVEPRDKKDLPNVMEQYSKTIASGNGALFFAVCRGKVSEGLDFADARARAVIVTGIPFPPVKDPKVQLKRDYLNDAKSGLTGDEWYNQQATRAINQAIGRVIRHRNDYGAILFFDDRFAQHRLSRQLSKWIRPSIRVSQSCSSLSADLGHFFNVHSAAKSNQSQLSLMQAEALEAEVAASLDFTRKDALNKAKAFFKPNPFFIDTTAVTESQTSLPPAAPAALLHFAKKQQILQAVESPPVARAPPDVQLAAEYLAQVKQCLPAEATSRFTSLLKANKGKQMDCSALLDALLRLFREHDALDLLPGFRPFISERNQSLFEQKLAALQAHTLSSTPAKASSGKAKENFQWVDNALGVKRSAMQAFFSSATGTTASTLAVKSQVTIPTIDPLQKAAVADTSNAASLDNCPICRERHDKPFKAKCGHVCCFACWSSWLSNTLECPLCRKRTRLSQLSKIYQ